MSNDISNITLNVVTRTEGTLFYKGNMPINNALTLDLSSGLSEYRFGLLQFYYSANPKLRSMMSYMLDSAVDAERVTTTQADSYTQGLQDVSLSKADIANISKNVLQPQVQYLDDQAFQLNEKVAADVSVRRVGQIVHEVIDVVFSFVALDLDCRLTEADGAMKPASEPTAATNTNTAPQAVGRAAASMRRTSSGARRSRTLGR